MLESILQKLHTLFNYLFFLLKKLPIPTVTNPNKLTTTEEDPPVLGSLLLSFPELLVL